MDKYYGKYSTLESQGLMLSENLEDVLDSLIADPSKASIVSTEDLNEMLKELQALVEEMIETGNDTSSNTNGVANP
ncbi:hypothetical protein DP163_gp018 [Sea otter poxvirus]|uniref:Uncharacterized protein n=1 Tax=Sea otter poxvirus TaxID=1416741 RepID=A0A2U9QHJ0_9POXV|nr:hypothetical protein DP163_gp018 [Sea otter poxvirus]AWU47063.1 hypothetical protein [Sea otter poxvirus]